jgi:hypothetical protein
MLTGILHLNFFKLTSFSWKEITKGDYRSQCYGSGYGSGSGSRALMTKNCKKNTAEKNLSFF